MYNTPCNSRDLSVPRKLLTAKPHAVPVTGVARLSTSRPGSEGVTLWLEQRHCLMGSNEPLLKHMKPKAPGRLFFLGRTKSRQACMGASKSFSFNGNSRYHDVSRVHTDFIVQVWHRIYPLHQNQRQHTHIHMYTRGHRHSPTLALT